MSQMRIFLSHSSLDKAFADALVHGLREAGADVWYDEHNLGAGQLLNDIQRELRERPVFILVLSKAAFASEWVRHETQWAWNLYRREPNRIILPVVAEAIEPHDFNVMLFLEDFKRVDGPGHRPYPPTEAIVRVLRLLALTPHGETPAPAGPQPSETLEDLFAHGKALDAQEHFGEAVSFFERATQLAPDNWGAWFYLGLTLSHLNRLADAEVAYDRALALNPQVAITWYSKGESLSHLNRHREALAAYDHALALSPLFADAWNNKGAALRALGREVEAQEAERQARDLGHG